MVELLDKDKARWEYNCRDVCYTLEILEPLLDILSTRPKKQQELYKFQINELSPILKERMNKGIRIDKGLKEEYYKFFSEILLDIQKNINEMLGMEFNTNSSPQKVKLFRDFFGMTLKKSKKGTDTCDAKAMLSYIEEYPEYKPFLCLLLEQSSLKVFTNNFLGMKLDADNRGRTNYKISGTKTGRLSSTKNVYGTGCLPTDAEAYTPNGWQKLKECPKTILQYNADGSLEFVKASWNMYDYNGLLYSYSGRCFRGDFTPEHRIIKSKRNKLHEQLAKDIIHLKGSYHVPVSGEYLSTNCVIVKDNWLQRYVMLSADGSKEINQWRIEVTKQRKKDRIKSIVPEGIYTKCRENYIRVKIKDEGYSKEFPDYFLNLPLNQRKLFIEELKYWDAHIRGNSFLYFTTIEKNAELVQTMCHISGYSASITIDETNSNEYGNTSTKPLFIVNVSKKQLNCLEGHRWFSTPYNGQVGCPTVQSGMWLVRYKKGIHITGNSNYQNIPEKGKIKLVYAVENLTEDDEDDDSLLSELSYDGKIALPNIKKIFLPDLGMELADADYSGADIQIVAADSQCKWLLDYFSNPNNKMKVYKYISSMFFQREITDEEYRDQKAIYHGLNYKLGVKKLASMAGISEHLAEQLKKFYFSLNPEIPLWHERLEREIKNKHYVTNIFGRQGWFVDHKDPTLMNKVCAFIPQSSIGDLINHAIVRILKADKRIQLLMQVHDSGVFQYPIEYAEECRKNILENMVLDLPYDPILRIPADMKVSRKSYGDTSKLR